MSKCNSVTSGGRSNEPLSLSLRRRRLTPSAYIAQHLQAFIEGFQKLSQTPLSSLMTILVLSIALLLPMGLFVLLDNMKTLTGGWQQNTAISLYLQPTVTDSQAMDIVHSLQGRTDIAKINYISPEQGLKDFEQQTGFQDVLKVLDSNPLPGVLEVIPSVHDQAQLTQLQLFLQQVPQVETVQLDMQWVNRINAMIELFTRIVYSIMVLLAVGVLLIIGNTIRLSIQKYHIEIMVIKLAGGSDAYIRRPFLYSGVLYGFTAGVIAWLLLDSFLRSLQDPIAKLVTLYGSQFQLHGLDIKATLFLLCMSILLGFIGSWLVIGTYLVDADIEQ